MFKIKSFIYPVFKYQFYTPWLAQKTFKRYFIYAWALVISIAFSQNVDYKQIPQKNNFQLIIDKSGSMSGAAILDAKAGAKYFVSKMKNNDAAGVIAFSSSIEDVVSFTSHKSSLNSGIASISVGGATHLYDALATGVKTLSGSDGARIIVYLTDGHDTGSNFSLSNVGSMFMGERIYVYGIGLGSSINVQALSKISKATGGDFMVARNSSELNNIYEKVLSAYYASHQKNKSSQGELIVKSIPSSKSVQIDGKNVGLTPLKLTDLAPGNYAATVNFSQDRTWSKEIQIKAGHSATVQAKRKDADKIIWIISKPHNANIFIDGEYIGRTTQELVNTKKRNWVKKVKKNPQQLKLAGIKPGRYKFEVIGFPDFDYGPEQKVTFDYLIDGDDVLFIDIFKNQITSTQKNFSGKQRRTSFDEMGGSDDLKDLNGNDNDFMNNDGFMDD